MPQMLPDSPAAAPAFGPLQTLLRHRVLVWPSASPWPAMTFVGVVKSANQSQGYGFIDCKETHAVYSRDVFLHKSLRRGGW